MYYHVQYFTKVTHLQQMYGTNSLWNDFDVSSDRNRNKNKKCPRTLSNIVETNDCSNAQVPYSYITEESSKKYLDDELAHDGDGVRGLVGRAFTQDTNTQKKAYQEETSLHIDISLLCSKLSENDQYLFSSIVNRLTKTDLFKTTRPPLNYTDICKFYTKSKHSINVNIPSPKTFEFDNHSCVSIESIVNHLLAFGVDFNLINSRNSVTDDLLLISINKTKEAHNIFERVKLNHPSLLGTNFPLILYVIIWSDDFEPNQTRKNRNSIWLKTVSICPPRLFKTSSLYTFPICLGRKGQIHDQINDYFNIELSKMRKLTMRYSKVHNDYVPVIVEPLVISADRPERSSLNHILGHSGNSSKRWMYSELISRKSLPSCDLCHNSRIEALMNTISLQFSSNNCQRCCDWDMCHTKKLCWFYPPTQYPTKKCRQSPSPPQGRDIIDPDNEMKKLHPIKVSYYHLMEACKFAFWNYIHDVWNKGVFRSYLKLISVKGSTVENFLSYADKNKNQLPITHDFLSTLPIPPMWTSKLRLEQCIDTPMHLLFQGIVKTIIGETQVFLKYHSLWTTFGKQANIILDDISKLKCDFCKVEKFNGENDYTTGGWIAETYVGFSRIYGLLLCPLLKKISKDSLGLNEFISMINSLHAMLSRLLSTNVDTTIIQQYVKYFLSCCVKFYSSFYDDENATKMFWNCSNFLSLLNIPQQIEQFGPLRLHWEGVHERFIQCVKPMLKNMRSSTSFLTIKMQQIHNDVVINNILRNEKQGTTRKMYKRFRDIYIYKSLKNLQDCLIKAKNIMAISLEIYADEDAIVGAIVETTPGLIFVPIEFIDRYGYQIEIFWFTPIKLDTRCISEYRNSEHIIRSTKDYFLLYAYQNDTSNDTMYSVISKSWSQRNCYGELSLPEIK